MAQTFECPSCALDVEKGSELCLYCGYEFPQQKSSVLFWAVVMALLLAWPIIKVIGYLFG